MLRCPWGETHTSGALWRQGSHISPLAHPGLLLAFAGCGLLCIHMGSGGGCHPHIPHGSVQCTGALVHAFRRSRAPAELGGAAPTGAVLTVWPGPILAAQKPAQITDHVSLSLASPNVPQDTCPVQKRTGYVLLHSHWGEAGDRGLRTCEPQSLERLSNRPAPPQRLPAALPPHGASWTEAGPAELRVAWRPRYPPSQVGLAQYPVPRHLRPHGHWTILSMNKSYPHGVGLRGLLVGPTSTFSSSNKIPPPGPRGRLER